MHKKILIILGLLTLSGCATHGVVSEVLPMKPISEAELSVGSSRVLARYKELLSRQLPMNTKVAPENSNGDFLFITELQDFRPWLI